MILAIAACCLVLQAGGDTARAWGQYDRVLIGRGELWRLVTGHLVHLGWRHLWPNVLALLIIGALFERVLTPLEWLLAAVLAGVGIDVGLYVLNTDVQWYVGLSGVLHGLVACGALLLLRSGSGVGGALVLGLAVKLAFEQWFGPVPLTEANAGGPVIVAAHLYGSAAGAVVAACIAVVRARGSRL